MKPSSPGWNMNTTSPSSSIAVGAQQPRRAHEARRVQIVTARVHAPVVRPEGLVGELLDGERVHIAAQQHGLGGLLGAARPGPPQHRHDRGRLHSRLGDLQPGAPLQVR